MNTTGILLLLIAAIFHSIWNTLLKKSQDKQVFIWLSLVVFTVLFFIPFCFIMKPISLNGWVYVFLTGLFEALYFFLLGLAYEHGDLSLVYPLSRGMAPVFVTIIALTVLKESITLQGASGILSIVLGVYIINIRALNREGFIAPVMALKQKASKYAVLTGLCTAAYTTVDKVGVTQVEPMVLLYLKFLIAASLLVPYMLVKKREAIKTEWNTSKIQIILVSILLTMAYLLVLMAMTAGKVSYVSAVREMSIVFGSIIGSFYLREKFADRKILGSAIIFAGILLITLAK